MNGDFSSKLDKILSNPAMMAQIHSLADTMTEDGEAKTPPPTEPTQAAPEPEPAAAPESPPQTDTPAAMPALFSPAPGMEKNIKNTRALLLALKPYLDDKRRDKIDKMLNMLRLAEMAGYFKNLI